MQKIAVISDIHGNMQALDTVLNDIKKQNPDKIICLGDYAMAGPQPSETIDFFIKNKNDFIMIQGNTDKFISEYSDDLCKKIAENAPIMAEALKYDITLLNNNQINFLSNLPENLLIQIENIKILAVHGSPRSNSENIFPNLSLDTVQEMIKDTDANIILCGHTHIPCGYQTNTKQTVINAGSVGRPFTDNPKASYLLINIDNNTFSAEHILLDYNKQLAAELLSKQNFKGSEKLANILITPSVRHL